MRRTRWITAPTAALIAAGLLAAAEAQDTTEHPASNEMAAAMSPEMMKAWMEYATPGPGQAALASRVGSWKCLVRHWQSPDSPVDESWGESEFSMMFDGRFLVQEYQSHSHGMRFEGLGITGFNNKTGQYEFTWIDNLSTGMMQGKGHMERGSMQWQVTMTDPIKGPAIMWGSETFDHHDRFVSTMYMKADDGRDFKVMEIIYERERGDADHHGHGHHGHGHHGHDHDHHGHGHHDHDGHDHDHDGHDHD